MYHDLVTLNFNFRSLRSNDFAVRAKFKRVQLGDWIFANRVFESGSRGHLFGGWKFTVGWNRRQGTERSGLQGERYIGGEINHLSSQMD